MILARRKGFTLIELLVVISIMSALSSIVFASLSTARTKAQVAGGKQFSGQVFRSLGADAVLYLDFEGMTTVDLAQTQINQRGTASIEGFSGTPGASTVVDDTSLFNRGKNLSIASGVSYPLRMYSAGFYNALVSRQFTMSAWYRSIPAAAGWRPLITWGWDANFGGIIIYINADGSVAAIAGRVPSGASYYGDQFNTSIKPNEWTHIAFSVNDVGGTVTSRVYINGKQAYQDVRTAAASTVTLGTGNVSSNTIGIGGYCCGMSTSGLLDDVGVFNRALFASEIYEIYARSAPEHGVAVR